MIFFINIIEKLVISWILQGMPFPPAPMSDDEPPPPPPISIDGYDFLMIILAIIMAFYFMKRIIKLN